MPEAAPAMIPGMELPHSGLGGPGIRRIRGNRFVLDRRTVNSNLQNMMSLLTQMRAMPDVEDGKANGFKLSEIQDGSIFQQMGLADGDVVTSVNGQPLTDPSQAMQLLNSLRDSQRVGVTITRGGQPMQFVYLIR